jgi:hypothetical protein
MPRLSTPRVVLLLGFDERALPLQHSPSLNSLVLILLVFELTVCREGGESTRPCLRNTGVSLSPLGFCL